MTNPCGSNSTCNLMTATEPPPLRPPLLLDGAKGTMLLPFCGHDTLPTELCVKNPQKVLDLHRSYIQAGSDIILSNSVAPEYIMAKHGLPYTLDCLRQSYLLASEAIHDTESSWGILISAPHIRSFPTSPALSALFKAMATLISQAMAYPQPPSLLMMETTLNLASARFMMSHISDFCSDLPSRIILSAVPRADGTLPDGIHINDFQKSVDCIASGLNVQIEHGINCGLNAMNCGAALRHAPGTVAFYPSDTYGAANAKKWAETVADTLLTVPARISLAGGCCNTTPENIYCLRSLIVQKF